MLRLCVLFFLVSFAAFSQFKFEKEDRVSSGEVPKKAIDFIEKCNFTKKIKWYKEESQLGKTFEAKTCFKKHKYSIEFDTAGTIIDAEVTIKFAKLPSEIQLNIKKTLATVFKKFKIEKTQIQYSGSESGIYKAMFDLKTIHEKELPKYEIVIKGKKAKTYARYEFLFNEKGAVLKELKFVSENSDNLEF